MAAPNIVNVSTITAKTAVFAVTQNPQDILSNSLGSNTVLKINALIISNISGSTTNIIASLFRSNTEYKIVHNVSVPSASSLTVIDKPTSIYLEEGDSLRLTASAGTSLHAVCSYEIIG